MANICITGIWHQGAVVSACLADLGNHVVGVCDKLTAEALNLGAPSVHEPELSEIILRNVRSGRLQYTSDLEQALKEAEFAFICTDTAVDKNDESDLSPIYGLAEDIGRNLQSDIVLCVTAQVPIGTTGQLVDIVRKASPGFECDVVYVPEFLRLGSAVETFRQADRFVIGCDDPAVAERVAAIYKPLERPIVFTDVRSAEMAKHAANAFLSTSISFINEIANLCELASADALAVSRILKLDQRIGQQAFLSPGLGFAGGTLGREIRALQKLGSTHQAPTPLMDAVWQVNAQRAQLVARRLTRALGHLRGAQVGILGLTYKPGTSTLRRAISLDIVRDLVKEGAQVKAFDPLANLAEVDDLPPMRICENPYDAAQESSALVLVTEWAGIESLDLPRLRESMKRDVFLDTRNFFEPATIREAGFRYLGVGRSTL